jgi:hypothetical protein
MLFIAIVLYILLTIAIGVYASTLVKNSKDYLLAGRNLPFFMATFVAFATCLVQKPFWGHPLRWQRKGFGA